jgi:hypothetical protein
VAGVTGRYCPHQGAPLDFGRIGEHGVRCLLHGWSFGVDGVRCDPAAAFRPATIQAWPAVEWGGLLWACLAEEPSPFEAGTLPNTDWGTFTVKAAAAKVLAALGQRELWPASPWPLTLQGDAGPWLVLPEGEASAALWAPAADLPQLRQMVQGVTDSGGQAAQ